MNIRNVLEQRDYTSCVGGSRCDTNLHHWLIIHAALGLVIDQYILPHFTYIADMKMDSHVLSVCCGIGKWAVSIISLWLLKETTTLSM